MQISVTFFGLYETIEALYRAPMDVKAHESDIRRDMLRKVGETAKELAPFLSGELRDSITWDDHEVGPTARYAHYVEFGTLEHGGPQPFLFPAADQHAQEYADRLAELASSI